MESDGSASEDSRRKREREEEMEEVVRRNKKTARTPTRDGRSKDDRMDLLMEMVRGIDTTTKEIQQTQKIMQENIARINHENILLKEENEQIRKEMKEMSDRIEKLEREKIRKNVIITGFETSSEDRINLRTEAEKFVEDKIGQKIKIKDAIKIGPSVCKIELEEFEDKVKIMKNKSKLRYLREKIYMDSEMTRKEVVIQRRLKQFARENREKGKHVKVSYQRAYMDGKVWKWNEREERMSEFMGMESNREENGKGDRGLKN